MIRPRNVACLRSQSRFLHAGLLTADPILWLRLFSYVRIKMAAARVLVIEGDKNLSHVSGPRPRRYSRQGHDLDDPTGKTLVVRNL